MKVRIGLGAVLIGLWAVGALAQQGPPPQGPYGPRAPAPDQPIQPQLPTLERRAPQPPQAPFRLTPQEEAQVERILNVWEQRSASAKNFRSRLKRWEYDQVFGEGNQARFEDLGRVQYAAPDKGLFEIYGERAEKWVCDGKAFYQYDYAAKRVRETRLPPELQGKDIANGPLPFLFGAKAVSLKQRYWLRAITPPEVQGQQTWLEAYPRFQPDAANFRKAELILTNHDMMPMALKLYAPSGKSSISYQFYEIVLNDTSIFDPLKPKPFVPRLPNDREWQLIPDQTPVQAGRVPAVR